ncbi:MAG: hypothetical protein KatS3mg077_2916 [Candidatus Binatia bacterium]|nr:MAG: hypothetical protein KatS3mg077_2916 [Candidatus Binatia bacterium]
MNQLRAFVSACIAAVRVGGVTLFGLLLMSSAWVGASRADYSIGARVAHSPDDINTTNVPGLLTLSGNDAVANVSLPFNFVIEGTPYNTIAISTNGWIEFGGNTCTSGCGTANSDPANACLPTSKHTNPFLAAYWDDLQTFGSHVRYGTVGQSPNRTFLVDYEVDVDPAVENNAADDIRFQIQLHEGSNLITVQYRDSGNVANGQGATIGFQSAGGASAAAYPLTCNGKILDDNRPNESWSADVGRSGLVTLAALNAHSPDDITGFSTLSGNESTTTVTMPFSVTIEGATYNTLAISTNGWIEFGGNTSGSADPANECLPTSKHTNPFLAAYWDDMQTVASAIRYGAVGSAPNRTFIVDFQMETAPGGSNNDVYVQVQIHETSNLISVRYWTAEYTANGQAATIGFQGAGGSSATAYSLTCNGKILDDNATVEEGWSLHPKSLGAMSLHSGMAHSPDDISGFATLTGDEAVVNAALPFAVVLNGVSYTTIAISTNGWIEFGGNTSGGADFNNTALPAANHTNPFLAAYWDDMVTTGTNIRYGTVGSPGGRTFIVDAQLQTFSGSFGASYQIQIHEGSNVINVKYRSLNPSANGQSATIGFQGAGGASAQALPLTFNGKILDDNRPNMSFSIAPLPVCGNGIIETKEQCDLSSQNGQSSSCCTAQCAFRAGGQVCRGAAGECDLVETCSGSSATCPGDAKKANGTACSDDGFPCTFDVCNGTSDLCQHPIAPTTTVCRPSIGVCDVTDYCDGVNPTCPPDNVAPPSQVCRPAAGDCDITEFCDGFSPSCPFNAKSTGLCRASAGVCDVAEFCDGVNDQCPPNQFQSAGTVCRTSAGDCDLTEYCTGTSAACPLDAKSTAVCRPAGGDCDVAESCDGVSNDCPADVLRPSTHTCRTAAGPCDVPENCTGTSVACPADQVAAAGTVCRAASGDCDVAEVCDGASVSCPADGIRPAGFVCRASAGVCDIAEECNGFSKACPADDFRPNTVVCRPVAGPCDVEEFCPGTGPNCPNDTFAGGSVECRSSAGVCDPAEFCDGTGPNCPADQRSPTTQLCRNIQGPCDVAEFCDGVSPQCPTDQFKGATEQCRAASGVCDVAEFCDGTGPNCPPDGVKADTEICRPAAGVCDVDDYCDGATKGCPADQKKLGDVCRGLQGACDVVEVCDGVSNDCPPDAVEPTSTVCRPAAGVCDVAESCNGVDTDCPPDSFQPASVVCRAAADGTCDVAENCTGTGASCPADVVLHEGDGCAGSDGNTCKHACRGGLCVDEIRPNCCGNGIPDVGEQCDDGDQEFAEDECPSGPGQNCTYADMVRGTRKNPAKDKYGCLLQWHVAHSSLSRDKFGLPDRDQACRDNDPTCDFDPTPGVCGFRVALCLNTTDSTLACVPSTGVTQVVVKPVSQRIASDPIIGPLATQNVAQVVTALTQLLDPQDPGAGYSKGLPLLANQKDWCSQPLEMKALVVQTAKDKAKRRVAIRTTAFDGSLPRPKRKTSMLRLTCYP